MQTHGTPSASKLSMVLTYLACESCPVLQSLWINVSGCAYLGTAELRHGIPHALKKLSVHR